MLEQPIMPIQEKPEQRPADRVRRGYLMGAVAASLLVVGFFVGIAAGRGQAAEPTVGPACAGQVVDRQNVPGYALKDVDFAEFWKVWDTVRTRHVNREDLTESQMFYGAIAGMVASLGDPYSVFFDPEYATKFAEELTGTFEGIGAEIGIKQDQLTVIAPLPETPAALAGIMPRDRILAIDGTDSYGMSVEEAVSRIRGTKGTVVKLLIGREGWEEAKVIDITRGKIIVKSVTSKIIEKEGKRFGLITVSSFNDDTAGGFNQAVRSMLMEGPDGLVLDLRNNPGGYLDMAVQMAGEWVFQDVVVSERLNDGQQQDYRSDGLARLADVPTVVLVNGGSASASEIVAGALQDYGKAKIIGEKTFGKGSVQEYQEFADGSALKLTVALWYTPLGRSIEKDGIQPDETVELTPEDFDQDRDPQLNRALEILSGTASADVAVGE